MISDITFRKSFEILESQQVCIKNNSYVDATVKLSPLIIVIVDNKIISIYRKFRCVHLYLYNKL